ncbi:hypothetical protein ACH5RR_004434 [Cinchona calisaya]|uniref:SHSP domain-containing protein n=1 Tax=Cinchona calisaya TaxID=153742 RepID=A0ABD3AXL3_9GENT
MEAKTGAAGRISDEEFQPFCKWQREEAQDTLIIHLVEFNKEQLKVRVDNNRGILKVSGERTVDATKKSKFYMEVVVPRNCSICNTVGIQAKFAKGHLYITIPKKLNVVVPERCKCQQLVAGSNIINPCAVDQNKKIEAAGKDQSTTPPSDSLCIKKDKMATSLSLTIPNNDPLQGEKSVSTGNKVENVTVNITLEW